VPDRGAADVELVVEELHVLVMERIERDDGNGFALAPNPLAMQGLDTVGGGQVLRPQPPGRNGSGTDRRPVIEPDDAIGHPCNPAWQSEAARRLPVPRLAGRHERCV
jgi:hypothetical protein